MNQFAEYISHGWKLCPVDPGSKGPRSVGWNLEANAVTDASSLQGAGLMHAYSSTCALDIDRMDDAAAYLAQHNINLADLLADPAAVQIISGRPNRGKLLYALQTPLPSKSFCEGAFELRCGTSKGTSAQDVLPPTIHPDTGKPYEWIGDWKSLPSLPLPVLALWQSSDNFIRGSVRQGVQAVSRPYLTALLSKRSANCGYDEWLRCGMAVHDSTGGSDEGLAIWDHWSAQSLEKYPGLETLQSHWRSFGSSATPITVDYLRRSDRVLPEDFEDVTDAEISLFEKPAAKPERPRFLSFLELCNRPEPEWIIKDILPEASFGIIYGAWGSGKTFAMIDMILSVALGHPFLGKPVKQGSVLVVAAEDNRGIQMRLQAGVAARGATDVDIRTLPAAPCLTDPVEQKRLMADILAEKRGPLIIVDTLTAATAGADQNSAKEMGELTGYCYRISAATGSMVILIHHQGNATGRMMGSTVLPASCDVIWKLDTEEIAPDEKEFKLTVEKLKNSATGKAHRFRLLPMANSRVVEWL